MLDITICPSCGSDRIKRVRRKWIGKVGDHSYTVPNLELHECLACGEKVYDREAMRKIESRSPAFAGAKTTK